jgi:hypothetical protein
MSSLEKLVLKVIAEGPVEAEESEKVVKRADKRRAAYSDDFVLTHEIVQMLDDCKVFLATAEMHDDWSELDEKKRYTFMKEVQTIQNLQDVLDGRYAKLKSLASQYITARNEDENVDEPESVGGSLSSETLGVMFRKEIRGGQAYVDWAELSTDTRCKTKFMNKVLTIKITLDPDGNEIGKEEVWTEEVNESIVTELVDKNRITLPMLKKHLKKTKVTAAMAVRKLKGE